MNKQGTIKSHFRVVFINKKRVTGSDCVHTGSDCMHKKIAQGVLKCVLKVCESTCVKQMLEHSHTVGVYI